MFLILLPIAAALIGIMASIHTLRMKPPIEIVHEDGSGIILIVGLVAFVLMHLSDKKTE